MKRSIAFILQIIATKSIANAFSINDSQAPDRRSTQFASHKSNSLEQSRRSFLPVVGAYLSGLIASPSLSYASTKDETNGKIILNRSVDARPNEAILDPIDVVDRISSLFKQIESKYSRDGLVDYISIGADSDFLKLKSEMVKLQDVSLQIMNEPTKTAFLINLYNILIKIAFVIAGIPKNDLTRLSFFDTAAVNIGGEIFTFNDLENGLLRANSVPPYHLTKPFGKGDKREIIALPKTDPRIHFALNCGARSCPPVRRYTPNGLDDELQAAATAFCDDNNNVYLNESTGEIRLSKIFKWYQGDFASSKEQIPSQILKYLTGDKKDLCQRLLQKGNVNIDYVAYDWATNDVRSRTFG